MLFGFHPLVPFPRLRGQVLPLLYSTELQLPVTCDELRGAFLQTSVLFKVEKTSGIPFEVQSAFFSLTTAPNLYYSPSKSETSNGSIFRSSCMLL